jgi:hypothetical protein
MQIHIFVIYLFFSIALYAQDSFNLNNTSWIFTDGDGDITMYKLHSDKKCSYAIIKNNDWSEGNLYSKEESMCEWYNNGVIFNLTHPAMIRIGLIKNSTISGTYVTQKDEGYLDTFTAVKSLY